MAPPALCTPPTTTATSHATEVNVWKYVRLAAPSRIAYAPPDSAATNAEHANTATEGHSRSMPAAAVAAGLSRIATRVRPSADRRRAPSPARTSTRTASVNSTTARSPRRSAGRATRIPSCPPENESQDVNSSPSISSPKPNVSSATNRFDSRRAGMASRTPNGTTASAPARTATGKGTPAWRAWMVTKAPLPANPACANEMSPEVPVSTVIDT
jgi:hypothetical protein